MLPRTLNKKNFDYMDKLYNDLAKSTVGFETTIDSIFNLNSSSVKGGFPPYNIVKKDDYNFAIHVALAGYNREDISIEQLQNKLTISCENVSKEDEVEYLYHGIAKRAIKLPFALDDTIHVVDAKMDNGMLKISLQRIIPEEKLPKKIEIF